MDRSIRILKLQIEGNWTAAEFGAVLSGLSSLYDLRLSLEVLREDQREWEMFFEEMMHFPPMRKMFRSKRFPPYWLPGLAPPSRAALPPVTAEQFQAISEYAEAEERLQVRKIHFASPGSIDVAGLGECVGHLKDLLLRLLERHDNANVRRLEEQRCALENDKLRVEVLRSFVSLAKDLGYSETDIRALIAYADQCVEPLFHVMRQKKLTDASEPEHGSTKG